MRLFLLLFCLFPFLAIGQIFQKRNVALTWNDFVEEYLIWCENEEQVEASPLWKSYAWFDELEMLHESPMNLNTANREDLQSLRLLTTAQVDSLLCYRTKIGMFTSLGELMLIRGLDYDRRRWLSLFVYVGDTLQAPQTWKEKWLSGRHSLSGKLHIPLFSRRGFQKTGGKGSKSNKNNYYLGNPLGKTLRYRYNKGKKLMWGLTLEGDPGEPVATYHNYPFDHLSGFACYCSPTDQSQLIVGDYHANFGDGLLLGHQFMYYPPADLTGFSLTNRFTPNTSTEETTFLRGIAYRRRWHDFSLMPFLSYRMLDGKRSGDTITTLYTSGLHRSFNELSHRRTLGTTTFGMHGEWKKRRLSVGCTAIAEYYNHFISPPDRIYNQGALKGTNSGGFACNWDLYQKKWELRGEAAIDKNGHIGTTCRTRLLFLENLPIAFSFRYLSPLYVAPHAQSLQRGRHVQNEWGGMVTASHSGWWGAVLRGFIDFCRHPAPTFRAAQASSAFKGGGEIEWRVQNYIQRLRYHYIAQQQNITGHPSRLEYTSTHRIHLSVRREERTWIWQTAADGAYYTTQTGKNHSGIMLSSRGTWQVVPCLKLSAFIACFATEGYVARLYSYQPQMRSSGAFPCFYDKGYSGVLLVSIYPSRQWICEVRWAATHYINRDHIGSGMQRIDGPTQSDLGFQLHYRF